jgi:putative hydrolase of the HAD superfamily
VKYRWTVAFDADDTLWHNERFFQLTQDRFVTLLADHAEVDHLRAHLLAAERRNLKNYGFGIKGFVLSMIETAVEVTEGRVPASVIAEILAAGRDMLQHPIDLLPEVTETLEALAGRVQLMMITKGDLLDQERKLAQSGLGEHFTTVEIVSDKTAAVYSRIFARADTPRAMMVGNSLKSDVIPAIAAGAWGVHVPHDLTWALEAAAAPLGHPRFAAIERIGMLLALLEDLG